MKNFLSHWLTTIIKPVFEVRPGERMKTLLMFSYFFLTIALIYILKPLQKSLFIAEFGAESLRFANMGEGVFLILVVSAYVQFAKRAPKGLFYSGVLIFFLLNLVGFWFLFRMNIPYLSGIFYLWQAAFSITMTTVFWTLANDLFHANEAKRLFGLIISGGSVGGIIGGFLTGHFAKSLSSEDLLLVSAGIVGICLILVRFLWVRVPHVSLENTAANTKKEEDKTEEKKESVFKLFSNSSYLSMLLALVIITKMTATIVDNQFGGIVEQTISGKEAMTSFYGQFFGWLNMLSFFMQLFVTSICLRYLGVGIALWILPVGLMILSLTGFLYPVLAIGIILKMYDGSVNYSVQQASKEVLYLPIASDVRRRIKPVIDMLGYRGAKAFAGIYIAVLAPLFSLSTDRLGLLVLTLIPFWLFIVWKMRKDYSQLLRDNLTGKDSFEKTVETKKAVEVLSFLHDEKNFHDLKKVMREGSSSAKKLAAASFLTYAQHAQDFDSMKEKIKTLADEEALEEAQESEESQKTLQDADIQFLKDLLVPELDLEEPLTDSFLNKNSETILVRLGSVLRDAEKNLEAKRRAVRILEHIPKQETVDFLLHLLASAQDHALRFIMIKALTSLQEQDSTLGVNKFLTKSEIAREVRIVENVERVKKYYYERIQSRPNADYLFGILNAVQDESLERVFGLLQVLYPNEMMMLVYERVKQSEANDQQNHAYASELLTNTLDPFLVRLIGRALEKRKQINTSKEEALASLRRASKSGDRWFSFISNLLVEELNLKKDHPDLSMS